MPAAVTVSEDGSVALRELPEQAPGSGELLVDLAAAGLCGTDLFKLRHRTAAAGSVLGHEVVGTIAAVGEGVVGFSPGDRIVAVHHAACLDCDLCRAGSEPMCPAFRDNLLAPGGFSERFLVRRRAVERATFGLPATLSDEAAVFLEPAACVLRGIRASGILDGRRAGRGAALILGGGSMGLLHLLLLQALAPELPVTVCDPVAERRELAIRLGAAAAARPGESAVREICALSEGRGADAVFDTVGGAGPLADGLAGSRPGGTVVLFAHAPRTVGDERADFDLNAFFKREQRLIGTYSSGTAEQREAFRLLATGRLDPSPLVSHRLPLSRFAEAVALAERREALKVLLVPDALWQDEA
jgi:L-iditol 2-dehydrogenase